MSITLEYLDVMYDLYDYLDTYKVNKVLVYIMLVTMIYCVGLNPTLMFDTLFVTLYQPDNLNYVRIAHDNNVSPGQLQNN